MAFSLRIAAVFLLCLATGTLFAQPQAPKYGSESRKAELMELLKTLPHRGEFFTEEAVIRAEPYLPDLFALTEKDLAGLDLFPYYAIVRGFCDRKKNRDYAVEHFSDILHPDLKLAWAVMLFNKSPSNPGIVQYLRTVLNSDTQARKLREILGSEFEDFEKRVRS